MADIISDSVVVSLVENLEDMTEDEVSDVLESMVHLDVIYEEEMEEVLETIEEERQKALEELPEVAEEVAEEIAEGMAEADEVVDAVEEIIEEGEVFASIAKVSKIVEKSDGWWVLSEKGKCLGGPYDTKQKAEKRLDQVEHFKNKKDSAIDRKNARLNKRQIRRAIPDEDQLNEPSKNEVMLWLENIAENYREEVDTDLYSQLSDMAKETGLDFDAIDEKWQRYTAPDDVTAEDLFINLIADQFGREEHAGREYIARKAFELEDLEADLEGWKEELEEHITESEGEIAAIEELISELELQLREEPDHPHVEDIQNNLRQWRQRLEELIGTAEEEQAAMEEIIEELETQLLGFRM